MDNHDVAWGTSTTVPDLAIAEAGTILSRCDAETSHRGPAPVDTSASKADMANGTAAAGNLPETFGALLRVLRCEAELTLDQVASAVGVAKPSVWSWENGKSRPKRKKWHDIAKALGVSPQVLASAAKAEALNKAASLSVRLEEVDRAAVLAAGREMIAEAYGVAPSAVRITLEL
jgi:transcriptional regulator with XRE-family HTH domain